MSGCCRTCAVDSRLPAVSKRMGVPPADEKFSMSGGLTPKTGVFRKLAAPTPRQPSAALWPQEVPPPVLYSSMVTELDPTFTIFIKPGSARQNA
jgi:hypothetical protein